MPPDQVTPRRPVVLELFTHDAPSSTPCWSAEISLQAAARTLRRTLDPARYMVSTRNVLIESVEQAQYLGLAGSPTVRINGHDIGLTTEPEVSAPCSSAAGSAVACRTYEWRGRRFHHAPAALIVDAALDQLAAGDTDAHAPRTTQYR